MKYTLQYPNYDRCILSISSSLLKKFGLKSNYPTLKELDKYLENEYKNIIFLILDCVGTKILENNLSEYSVLKKNVKRILLRYSQVQQLQPQQHFIQLLPV